MGFLNADNLQAQVDMHQQSMMAVIDLLDALRHEMASDPGLLAPSDGAVPAQAISKDFPFPGATRVIVKRTPIGPNPPAAGTGLLWEDNVNRLGGTVVNKATAGLTLYLSDQVRPGTGTIWLAPNGGSWDFRLSNVVWCGNVYAVADTGAVNVAGATL